MDGYHRRLRPFLWLLLLAATAAVLLSLNAGLELADESGYIYLLNHPQSVVQFLDYRIWAPIGHLFGGSVAVFRLLPLLLVTASALIAARGMLRVAEQVLDAPMPRSTVYLFAAIGAVGFYSIIRPTMNYGASGVVFGNLFVACVLLDLARAPARCRPLALIGMGISLALLFTARFPAIVAGLAFLAVYMALRPNSGGVAGKMVGFVVPAATAAAAIAVLAGIGFDFAGMIRAGALLGRSYSRPVDVLVADLVKMAIVAGMGLAIAAGLMLADRLIGGGDDDRRRSLRSWLMAAVVVGLLALVLVDQHAVILGKAVDAGSPFSTNTNLYGTTYGAYALIACLIGLMLAQDLLGWAAPAQRRRVAWPTWALAAILLFGTLFSFLGTNTGLLPRSALNSAMLHLLIAFLLLAATGPRRLFAPWLAGLAMACVASATCVFVVLNVLWSPYNVNGGWRMQTAVLAEPSATRGLRVSPATARLAGRIRSTLHSLGFAAGRDAVVPGYDYPGLALLSGAPVAGYAFFPGPAGKPNSYLYDCRGVVEALQRQPRRRLFGINVETYEPALRRCLGQAGVDFAGGTLVRAAPDLTIRIMPVRTPRPAGI